jgi:hypothetical protein
MMMRTNTVVRIESATQDLEFGVWISDEEGEGEFVSLHGMDAEEAARMAEVLGCSTALVDALVMFAETIADLVGSDLCDIWKRLDAAGIE